MELTLLGIVDDSVQRKLKKRFPLPDDLQLYFSLFSSFEIPQGQIFSKASIGGQTIDIHATLEFITQSYFIEMDFIGAGWRNIVGIKFMGSILQGMSGIEKLESWGGKRGRQVVLKVN